MSGRPSNRPPSAPDASGGSDESPPPASSPQQPHPPPPPHSSHGSHGSHGDHDARPGIDRILPELIRRGLEVGREKVSESIPRELASQVVSQLGDVRSGIVKAVAQEVGRFLREADIATEIRKVLTGLNVEAQVKFGFTARDDGTLKPEVDVNLGSDAAQRERGTKRPPPSK